MFSLLKEIEITQTGILPPLLIDYIQNKSTLSHLVNYPFDFSHFEKVIADKSKDNTDRKLLVEVLQKQYADIPATAEVSDSINLLLNENTFTVVAAHQPCLFMGSLYNIYKISCAINITRQLKKQFPAFNFVPVFWLGSEDHDVEELNHTYVNGKRIEWSNAGTGAAGRWETSTMKAAIEELKSHAAYADVVSILEEGMEKYKHFGKFTQYFVNEIFKEHGLVVLNQDDVNLKRKFSGVIKDEILHSRAVEVLKANVEFLDAAYKAQAKPRDINFFYLGDNYRERIIFNSATDKFEVNNHKEVSFSRNELIAEIDDHPDRFSPNVIYRPLYQEMVLPNLAFVGGAGELSYWLELKPLFDYYNVNYPMQVLRNSASIITSSVKRKLDKLNMEAENLFGDVEQLINSYVRGNMSVELNLEEEKKLIAELYVNVTGKAEKADATLKNNAVAEQQKALAALDNLEAKILKAEKRKQETAVTQIRGIHSSLFPENSLQERKENFIPFYAKEFVATVVKSLNPFDRTFKFFLKE